jgi:hypothetical protein
MNRAALGDIELEYELHGVGEPVLLIHQGTSPTGSRHSYTSGRSPTGISLCTTIESVVQAVVALRAP